MVLNQTDTYLGLNKRYVSVWSVMDHCALGHHGAHKWSICDFLLSQRYVSVWFKTILSYVYTKKRYNSRNIP